ncbi:hypothetical protein FJY68_08010 [candidate division WOR-3 bacterium]|uniref:Gingipain domain-containing protein n=1 Tax=candidate division WOR-3 bacterium TaxID=2052148 RepID=A0A937XHI7_UNCW3|nr:hypothetical protein [candidate division WOR-3 bacterium]
MRQVLCAAALLLPAIVSGQPYDHVTVTTDSFVTRFAPLGAWLENNVGLADTTVSAEAIYASFPGRDRAEKIRSFIRHAYQNWGTTHVLLGGDDDILPCRKGWVDASSILPPIKDTVPTDLYFSDLDGDWDRDGDSLFGEVEDSVDLYPDVHVARLPATYISSVDLFVDKFLAYCADSSAAYLRNVLLTGFDISHNPEVLGEATMELYDSAYLPQSMKPCTRVYDSHTGNHRTAVLNALNAGQHIYIQWDHGGTDAYGCGWENHNWTLGRADVQNLTNGPNYTIFIAVGCLTGHFDGMDCILEYALGAPNGGAVAGIGNSRLGVLDAYNPQRKYAAMMVEGFVSSLFGHSGPGSLEDFTASRARAAPFADTNLVSRWSDYEMNLMGAPAMPVWVTSGSGVEENHKPRASSPKLGTTVVRGVLFLPRDMTELPGNSDRVPRPLLLDICGRSVMTLKPGPNHVSHLASGVYFVCAAQRVNRVVVAR